MANFVHQPAYIMDICDECQRLRGQYRATADSLMAAQRELANYELLRNSDFVHRWNESERALKELWRVREEMVAHAAAHQAGAGLSKAEAG